MPVAAALLATLLAGAIALGGSASAARTEAKKLGPEKGKIKPECPKPEEECEVVGFMTGIQKQAGRRGAYKMPADGTIVAWEVEVSQTNAAQTEFFTDFFKHDKLGGDPVARIAVLRRAQREKKGLRFKLRGQSAKVELEDHQGSRTIFALRRPLRAAKGDVVGITVPTWASILDTSGSDRRNVWIASRSPEKCGTTDDVEVNKEQIEDGRAHQDLKSVRRYGCDYSARLTYWAYYVPKDAAKPDKKKGDGKKGD